jgi:excinuclease UvrABC helicase subunit UvrB
MLSRRPAALAVLDEKEYRTYYEAKANSLGLVKPGPKGTKVPDIEEAINRADEAAQRVLNKEALPAAKQSEPIHEVAELPDGKKVARSTEMVTEDIINPRVQHLCNQVKAELSDQEKLPANQFLAELQQIEHALTMDDWEYIRAHGMYKSVKNYAKKMVAELAAKADVDDGNDAE